MARSDWQRWSSVAALALLLSLAGCGPFQVGIEQAPASPEITATAPAGLTAATPANPEQESAVATVSALQIANARLAAEVARLTAEQAQLVATVKAAPASTPLPPTAPPAITAAPTPTATAAPLVPTRITFPAGSASATVSPDLAVAPHAYVLKVLAGQHLILSADHDLDVQVSGPDGRMLVPVAIRPQQWEYVVGQTGDQTITLSGEGRPTVTIYVPPR